MDDSANNEMACPSCGDRLAESAVLCVACGYDFRTGKQLSTAADRPNLPSSSNPYAVTSTLDEINEDTGEFDLDPIGLRAAQGVVSGAATVYWSILACACFAPCWLVILYPWYVFLLIRTYALRLQYNELRHPNSFSPNYELVASFDTARIRLAIGVGVGTFIWLLILAVWAIES